jgi:cell division protein FtsW (lipid II flippase)
MWSVSNILLIFALMAFIIGVILALTVITKKAEHLDDNDRHNATRAHLFLPIAFTLGILVLCYCAREKMGMHHLCKWQ